MAKAGATRMIEWGRIGWLPDGGVGCGGGQTLSPAFLSGNLPLGSSVIFVILRPGKSTFATNVRLPPNQTSTGYLTMAVFASSHEMRAAVPGPSDVVFGGFTAAPLGANSTLRISGEGICPS